ncbi:uncharacterized protein LOC111638487 [Centruroides sculpturatus]|uniref:uncharacterized protein LOC111638487 n=1 Tax=Centruroides sculpturatus TaxID=218467 RepID=UPI000C6E0685|nr:uncharacterized protein LOC111638487 [Centruroides sculpturatus]
MMISKIVLQLSLLVIVLLSTIVCQRNTHSKLTRRVRRFLFPSNSLLSIKTDLKMPISLPGRMTGSIDMSLPISIPLSRFLTEGTGRDDNRMELFFFLENLIQRFGIDGKSCLLKSICEIAEIPMDEEGVIGTFINGLFKVSNLTRRYGMDDYIKAEKLGRMGGNCSKNYKNCPFSFFSTVSLM